MRIKGKGKSILTRQRLPVLGLFEGLLDQVSGAAAAYSIRLLRADYSGGLVRVRAFDGSSDQGEADVLPDSNNQISLSSELTNRDSTAGSSGRDVSTLGELVTNTGGTDYDGFVSEWKDQSPNANHAENTTASEQPKLVDAGNLVTENGKPAIKFDGSDVIGRNDASIATQPHSAQIVGQIDNYNLGRYFIDASDTNNTNRNIHGSISDFGIFAGSFLTTSSVTDTTQMLIGSLVNGSNSIVKKNATQILSGDAGSGDLIGIMIGASKKFGDSGGYHKGTIQEVVVFDRDLAGDRSKVENLQNDFYSIY